MRCLHQCMVCSICCCVPLTDTCISTLYIRIIHESIAMSTSSVHARPALSRSMNCVFKNHKAII